MTRLLLRVLINEKVSLSFKSHPRRFCRRATLISMMTKEAGAIAFRMPSLASTEKIWNRRTRRPRRIKSLMRTTRQSTKHYEKQFDGLMAMIKGLGVPSINDRQLKIVSSLSPDTALRGSTDLLYVDADRDHKLPELYNGLGFKNLIYMAIQARHFHSQWLRTPQNRSLCQCDIHRRTRGSSSCSGPANLDI